MAGERSGLFFEIVRLAKEIKPKFIFLENVPAITSRGDFKLLEKLPKWGMIVDGVLYPLHPLERYTNANAGSYWLTPSTMEHLPMRTGEALENALHRGKNRYSRRKVSGRLNEQVAYPQMWPTPDANARGARKNQNGHHYTLPDAIGSGKLNPNWVAWLMGYNSEWINLEPWAIAWFLSKSKRRLKS